MSLGNYTGAVVREDVPMRSESPLRVMPVPGHDSGIVMHCLHFNITMRFKKRQTANIVIKTKR